MSSLYRKYRPATFTELIGQDHIRTSLEAAIKNKNFAHAFLFSGPRGTGKTSLARLLAKAVNCAKSPDGINPCNKCDQCLELSNGQSVDVMEIDAASNRGIDEIRELRDKIMFAPARSAFKIYIIDEVHMLTKEAFNALLKTLEEPPKHAIFVLATTELHKVPETIISRCQRYQFHRAELETVKNLLANVAKKEKIAIDDDGLGLLAERADGSYRDGLTLLGNVSSHEKLDGQTVRELIGLPPSQLTTDLLKAMLDGQTDQVAAVLREFISAGGDLSVLVRTLADSCKKQILQSPENADAFVYVLEELLHSLARARSAVDSNSIFTAKLISLTLNMQPKVKAVAPTPVTDLVKEPVPEVPVAVDAVTATESKESELTEQSTDFWGRFLEAVKEKNHALYAVIRSAKMENLTESKLSIAVRFRFYSERLYEPKNRTVIEALASQVAGRPLALECLVKADLDVGLSKEEDLYGAVVDVFELEEVA